MNDWTDDQGPQPLTAGQDLPYHVAECRACQTSTPALSGDVAEQWAIGHEQVTGHRDFRIAAIHYFRVPSSNRTGPDQAEDVD
ncbi:hypothetical protein [Streptomyces sp. UNOB3_S3]|uniref:DUF7848 domain-containing protein n=1 Tax=Streptomyces sp. UNOB3_S3 TaxID=2871682 RepID=UPI001E43D6CA|nr:hypothetical protein [Streptomyces sp. UNOB3_S3]MCC3779125.1 hypothetical protein [Streptomyces sp. UNOB3_S3]